MGTYLLILGGIWLVCQSIYEARKDLKTFHAHRIEFWQKIGSMPLLKREVELIRAVGLEHAAEKLGIPPDLLVASLNDIRNGDNVICEE